MCAHTEKARIARIWAPLHGGAHNFTRGNVAQIAVAVALAPVRSDGRLQNRNGDNLGFASSFLSSAAPGCRQVHLVLRIGRNLLTFPVGQDRHGVAGLQPGTSPIKPGILFAGQFAELNVVPGGGSKLAVLPARYGHGGTVEFPGEFSLRNSELLPQVADLFGPFGGTLILSFSSRHSVPLRRKRYPARRTHADREHEMVSVTRLLESFGDLVAHVCSRVRCDRLRVEGVSRNLFDGRRV